MNTLGFLLGKFKTIMQSPILYPIYALLDVSFDNSHTLRSVAHTEIVNI